MNVTFRIVVIIIILIIIIVFIFVCLVIKLGSSVSNTLECVWLPKTVLWVWIYLFLDLFLSNADSILVSLTDSLWSLIAIVFWIIILINFTFIFWIVLIFDISYVYDLLSRVFLRLISIASHTWHSILLLPSLILLPSLLLVLLLWWWLSLHNMLKLIAYTAIVDIVHRGAGYITQPVIMTSYVDVVCNYVLNTIVVAHNFNCVDNTNRWYTAAWAILSRFWINFVIVSRNHHVRDRIASSDLYLTVMASDDDTVTWLHENHWNTVIGNVNWVLSIIWS